MTKGTSNDAAHEWKSLIERLTPRIARYMRSFESDPVEIADLVQETWFLAWDRIGAVDAADIDWPAIRQYCRAAAASRQRARRRRERIGQTYGQENSATSPHAVDDFHPDSASEACDARAELVWDWLLQLAPRQREILIWRVVFDRSEEETAELVGVAIGTVKAHCHRALRHLRSRAVASIPSELV
jgi:RNA polymerase sigma factor (sigma-70 family)